MSQENVEIVRPVYDALNRRDWDAVFSAMHVDFELPIPALDNLVLEPEEFFESGAQVVVFVKTRAQIKGGSGDLENRHGHLWTIRDGTILSLKMFPKREDALGAAGLVE